MVSSTRRHFLTACSIGSTLGPLSLRGDSNRPPQISIARFDNAGASQGLVKVNKIVLSDTEWRKRLSPHEYGVTRKADTEIPFTGKDWNNHVKGLYRCLCCSNALFSSETKFESGTGWPSFWKPIAKENIETATDYSFGVRREVRCRRCEAHLGHVFNDGPQPTGLRYCMNGTSLRFEKA